MGIFMISPNRLLRSLLFMFLCCLFSIGSCVSAVTSVMSVHVDYQAGSGNVIIKPKVRGGAVISGKDFCEKNSVTVYMYSNYAGASGARAYPIAMPCDQNSQISLQDFVQAYLDAAAKASGGGDSITFPAGMFPDNAIVNSLCISTDGKWGFGCSQGRRVTGGGDSSPSCSVTKNLVFYYEGVNSSIVGKMITQPLPIECSDKVNATITLENSPSHPLGYTGGIYIDGAEMFAKFYVGAQDIGAGRPITLNKGITNLSLMSILLNQSHEEHKPGFYKANGVLTITID